MRNATGYTGIIEDGLGVGNTFTTLEWFQRAVKESVGWHPYPGTFNVRLIKASSSGYRLDTDENWANRMLNQGSSLVPPTDAWSLALLLPVLLSCNNQQTEALAVRPLIKDYAPDLVELVAEHRLRDFFKASSGETIRITPSDSELAPIIHAYRPKAGKLHREITMSKGNITLTLHWYDTGSGLDVGLFGGEEHIGSVVMATPRPSLADKQVISATSSVLAVVGHKDDELARVIAELLAKNLNEITVVTSGVHIGPSGKFDLSQDDFNKIFAVSQEMAQQLVKIVRKNGNSKIE